jgi:phospholipid transport system transporter-binding protein
MDTQSTAGSRGSSPLKLAAQCTLREASDFKACLLECLEQQGDVVIDAAAVERIDTAALQLLVAFSRDLADSGRSLSWSAASSELRRATRQLGIDAVLAVPPQS